MTLIIHFRSKQNKKYTGIGSQKKLRGRGSEYDTLHPATPHDDARDIAWKQSAKSESLYVKSREDTMNISIRLIGVYDESWDFSLNYGDEKIKFYQTLYRACEDTSRHYKHTYNENFYTHVGIQKISSLLEEKQIKKELIIIVVSDLLKIRYTGLSSIARHNDIVVLHLLHPYESKPDSYSNILCESRSIEAIPYKKSLFQAKKEIQEYLSSNNVAYISGISTENPVDLLNHFFKYRYAR